MTVESVSLPCSLPHVWLGLTWINAVDTESWVTRGRRESRADIRGHDRVGSGLGSVVAVGQLEFGLVGVAEELSRVLASHAREYAARTM